MSDICIANLWPTTSRMYQMGPFGVQFTRTLLVDDFMLITPIAGLGSKPVTWPLLVWTSDNGDSDPYSPQNIRENIYVWAAIIGTLVFGGLVLFVVGGHTNSDVYPGGSRDAVVRTIFNSVQTFFGAGDFRHDPHTHSGRLVILSMAIMILIVLTIYGAKMTTMLILAPGVSGTYSSIKDAVDKGARICGPKATQAMLESKYPELHPTAAQRANGDTPYVNHWSRPEDILVAMDPALKASGNPYWCDVAIITQDEWNDISGRGEHCNKTVHPETVFTFSNSYAVRSDLRGPMSWAMTKNIASGKWEEVEKKWKEKLLANKKPCYTGNEKERPDPFVDVKFPLLLSLCGSGLSLVCFVFWDIKTAPANQPGQHAQSAGADSEPQDEFEHATTKSLRSRLSWARQQPARENDVEALSRSAAETLRRKCGLTPALKLRRSTAGVIPDDCDGTEFEAAADYDVDRRACVRPQLTMIDGMLKNRRALVKETGGRLKADVPLTLADIPMLAALIQGNAISDVVQMNNLTDMNSLDADVAQRSSSEHVSEHAYQTSSV